MADVDPFDLALRDLQRFIAIDVDGDGKPDGYTTADVIRGRDVSRSPARRVADTMESLRMPYGPVERGGSGGYAVPAVANFLTGTVGQVADAVDNFQTGVRQSDPVKAGAAVAQGALTALPLTRAGAPLVSTIPRALTTMGSQIAATDVARNGIAGAQAAGLTPDQQRKKSELEARVAKGNWRNAAERRSIEGELGDLRRIDSEASTQENAARIRREEADAAARRGREESMLTEARGARQDVLDKAPKPFHEEFPGWSRVQPFIPAAVGFASHLPGAVVEAVGSRRAAGRWRGAVAGGLKTDSPAVLMDAAKTSAGYRAQFDQAPGLAKAYAPAAAIGGVEGAVTANVPEAYNALALPAVNPEVTATREYLKRLPPDHPEAVRAREALEDLPEANPYQSAATAHFRTPANFLTKMGIGALEGAGGAAAAVTLGKGLGPSRSALPYAGAAALEGRIAPEYVNSLSRAYTPGMVDGAVTQRINQRLRDEMDALPSPLPSQPPPQLQGPQPVPQSNSAGISAGERGPQPSIAPAGKPDRPPEQPLLPPDRPADQMPKSRPPRTSLPTYSAPQMNFLRPRIRDEVAAGRDVPVYGTAAADLSAAGLKVPSEKALAPRLDDARNLVAEMRARGIPDDTIASVLFAAMQKGSRGLPAIGLAAGMGGLAEPAPSEPMNYLAR